MPNEQTDQPCASGAVSGGRQAGILVAAALAFVVKVVLALMTYGTNDVYTYERFGVWSRYFGADLYRIAPDLNHPPSMLHFLRALLWMSEHTHLPFHFWIRFPGILADAGTVWLLWRILGPRIAERSVFISLLLIACAPTSIMISGFHGNTDPVMIFFVLLAVWLAGDCDKCTVGGIAYGLAICIKITPIVLVPVLVFYLQDWRRRIGFLTVAAAVVLVAWTPYLFQQPLAIFHQVFGYKSSYGLWGISWLLRELANAWPSTGWINGLFYRGGTPVVMVAILALSAGMSRMSKRPSLYAQVGMVFLFFFTATSGFAVQYLAWLTPWVAELGAVPVALFTLTGSVFLLVVYNYWNLGMPWYLAIAYPWSPHMYFQLLCWVSVVILAGVGWYRMRSGAALAIAGLERITPTARVCIAGLAATLFLVYPAVVHVRRDTLNVTPVYAEDSVLYTQEDEYRNLASELARRGRASEAEEVGKQADLLLSRAKNLTEALTRVQPERAIMHTPEEYVDASLDQYNQGDYAQCVYFATASLEFRPGMPAAWNNISLCNAELGNWDKAAVAATEALRIEPESDVVRQNLDWILAQQRLAKGARQ